MAFVDAVRCGKEATTTAVADRGIAYSQGFSAPLETIVFVEQDLRPVWKG